MEETKYDAPPSVLARASKCQNGSTLETVLYLIGEGNVFYAAFYTSKPHKIPHLKIYNLDANLYQGVHSSHAWLSDHLNAGSKSMVTA